ncbi:hypothetical protein SDC9_205951 [bioreactor metagenome]|uniref:Uncharacterized protein n=1 Tax=bioreactor metagenome TaxID=1076179 RepID=A0A645J3L9_9ZZZZ
MAAPPNYAPPVPVVASAPVAPAQTTTTAAPVTPAANPAPAAAVPTSAPTYTLDQIANAGATLVDAGKMGELIGLLGQFGVAAVTDLKPEQYGAFATALRGLGARI